MTTPDMPRFIDLMNHHNRLGVLRDEALRHEMTATLIRNQLTHLDEGGLSFNTIQLCWILTSNPGWTQDHPLVHALLLSTLIEDRLEIFRDAQICGIIPASWTWVQWADGFGGNEDELIGNLTGLRDPRQRCGAACLATRHRPQAIGRRILGEFRCASMALVYHLLLNRALGTSTAASLATSELAILGENLEVLFAADTDRIMAKLVTVSDLSHPEEAIAPMKEACGDFTATAIARRHLESGRPREALDLVKDLRFLSPAFDQAIIVAALAALESSEFELCRHYASNIKDQRTRLQVTTRLAQAVGDATAELNALVALAQLNPRDGQVFVQLVNLLDRTKHTDLARQVCMQAQERFTNDPLVEQLIRRHLVPAGASQAG